MSRSRSKINSSDPPLTAVCTAYARAGAGLGFEGWARFASGNSRRLLIVVQLAPLLRDESALVIRSDPKQCPVSRRTFASPTCICVSGDGAVRLGDDGLQDGEIDLVEIGDV